MSLSPGYSWVNGEIVTATKLNLAATPTIGAGSAATPSLGFSNDTNTGFYSYAADSIGWSAGGAVRGTFSTYETILNGDDNTGFNNIPQLGFGYNGAFSYQHFLQTRHAAVAGGTGNAFVLWLNNSVTAGASSAPGTSNAKAFDFSADNLKLYSNSGILGLTLDSNQAVQIVATGTGTGLQVGSGTGSAGRFDLQYDSSVIQGISVRTTNAATGGDLMRFLNSSASISGSITWTALQAGVAYNTTSDGRLKKNVRDLDNSGELIDSMKPRIFDWINGPEKCSGFIAQELNECYPDAVTPGDDGESINKRWQVDFSKIVPVLVAEIKSLRARCKLAGI